MGKKYHFNMPRDEADQLDKYIQIKNPDNTSQVLRDIINEKLKTVFKESVKTPEIQQGTRSDLFLKERFTCRITHDRVQVQDLPCVTDPDFQCRDSQCQAYIKKRLGLS